MSNCSTPIFATLHSMRSPRNPDRRDAHAPLRQVATAGEEDQASEGVERGGCCRLWGAAGILDPAQKAEMGTVREDARGRLQPVLADDAAGRPRYLLSHKWKGWAIQHPPLTQGAREQHLWAGEGQGVAALPVRRVGGHQRRCEREAHARANGL